MDLEGITCGNCGAPLQVPPGVRFITCNHCHTSLAVHRSETATYTEKPEFAIRTGGGSYRQGRSPPTRWRWDRAQKHNLPSTITWTKPKSVHKRMKPRDRHP